MTVSTHNKWTLFRRAHVAWAFLYKVFLDGHDLFFFRSNSLPLPPCHLHVRGFPAFWSCSVFSVSTSILVLIYAHVLYLSIYSSSSSVALFFILHHWANDVMSIIRELLESSSRIGRYPYISCTTSYHILLSSKMYVSVEQVFLTECTYVLVDLLPELWTLWRTIPESQIDQGISRIDFAPCCCCL